MRLSPLSVNERLSCNPRHAVIIAAGAIPGAPPVVSPGCLLGGPTRLFHNDADPCFPRFVPGRVGAYPGFGSRCKSLPGIDLFETRVQSPENREDGPCRPS